METTDQFRKAFDEDDGSYPEPVLLDSVGDELVGRVAEFTSGTSREGRVAPIVVIHDEDTDGQPRSLWLWHKVLRSELERLDVRIGSGSGRDT